MTESLVHAFKQEFDAVGIIRSQRYMDQMTAAGTHVPKPPYPTMVVVGLAYPRRTLSHSTTHLVPSFYTFGRDYHDILGERIERVMDSLPYAYWAGVDKHGHDERSAAEMAGIGFRGKNQLIINETYGSYLFLGIVFIDVTLNREYVPSVTDSCGDCRICIDACPAKALSEDEGFITEKCISSFNQTKRTLTDREITLNHSLFGCDICQTSCPKNKGKGTIVHPEFEMTNREKVPIVDLFEMSNREFYDVYGDMAYVWRGKTVLMRNALTLLLKQRNTAYNTLIEQSIASHPAPWYVDTAKSILARLKHIAKE